MSELNSVFVVPGYTFFYWGFTLPKKEYASFTNHFNLAGGHLSIPIELKIKNKKYSAKLRLARINRSKPRIHDADAFKKRDVVQIFYDSERETLKALRKLFIYSYASTINKSKSKLKELLELVYIGENTFEVKPISQQETDFDDMFQFMEDKNLFEFWKKSKDNVKADTFFIDFTREWIDVSNIKEYYTRSNVIYFLYHSDKKLLYIGKANILGDRVQKGKGRLGLPNDWDKFMFFEIHPEYQSFIEQIEAFSIRSFASLIPNEVGTEPLTDSKVKLVNRQLRKK